MQSSNTYYITTPIYYPSSNMHIGNTYCTIIADSMARYKKMRGYDVLFLTGTDEHGQKIERLANEKNVEPLAFVDEIVKGIKELWSLMDAEYDIYMRTTFPWHEKAVQKIFKQLFDQGDIYKGSYEGLYCTPCETFFTELQLKDGLCPDCGRAVEKVKEEAYFLKLTKYQDQLLKYIEENETFLMPKSRRNEMLSFIKSGLEDVCVSRTSVKWGVPVSFDPVHTIYVWIDALSNYATALGYQSDEDSRYKKYWPADLHLVGKDIYRFHTIIWPIMLLALGEPLPKQIYGHGWLNIDGEKISKSKGNAVDPNVLIGLYGVDAIRYYLMREIAMGQDSNYTVDNLIKRINYDLANDLGNLLSRTAGMIDKYFGGTLPAEQSPSPFDAELCELAEKTVVKVEETMDQLRFSEALEHIWTLIRRLNKYADENQPWVLVKDETKKSQLANVLYHMAEGLRVVSVMISPVMPNTQKPICEQLGIADNSLKTWDSLRQFGLLSKTVSITKGSVIFPRIDIKSDDDGGKKQEPEKKNQVNKNKLGKETISIDDFAKLDLKVGVVLECEKITASEKLLKSQVRIGSEVRQIVSGIAKYYTPEQMVGKKVIVVVNLKPVKLCGFMSEGMIMAASDNGTLNIITTDGDISDGATVS